MSIIQQKDSECSTNGKNKAADESCNKNDESIIPPALLLNDQIVEWDSMLDDTKPIVSHLFLLIPIRIE